MKVIDNEAITQAASSGEQAVSPRFRKYTYRDDSLAFDDRARFYERVHNVTEGLELILDLLKQVDVDAEAGVPLLFNGFEKHHLITFAQESARMLSEESVERIEFMNQMASKLRQESAAPKTAAPSA